jgi:hypothetical protein
MSFNPPSSANSPPAHGISTSDELTEVFAAGALTQKSVFPTSPHALPVGSRIGEFEVHRLIGEGGFGIVYLCYDQALDRYVALKEYMPSSLATRQNATLAIVVKSKHHEETFEAGMKSFINEARLLAQFDHPSLVKVYRFWQANGTAYMTMPFYEGPTLKQALASLGQPPDEATLRAWLEPMLDALDEIHRFSCYHRDIAPDNILLTAAGPLLLDFGAARRVIGDMTQALTVVLKPGFAPIEQYGDAATLSQGAWTDLYALASVVYYAITGRPPMSAVDRLMDDKLEPLSHRVAGRYSHALLAAVDTALAVRPQDRPQNVAAFRALIRGAGDGQTTDLHLWADDDAPTEMDVFLTTQAGALPGAAWDDGVRTAPQGLPRGADPATTPLPPSVALPDPGPPQPGSAWAAAADPGAATQPYRPHVPMEERTMLVRRPEANEPTAPAPTALGHAATRPVHTASPSTADTPGQTPPRPLTAAAFGAGLAPLSGALANPMPPRPLPMAERTAMPSLLPLPPHAAVPRAGVAAGAAAAVDRAAPGHPAHPQDGLHGAPPVPAAPQRLSLWLSGAALVLAALVAAWTFTRSAADPEATADTSPPAPVNEPTPAPAPALVTPAVQTPAANAAPIPSPVPAPPPTAVRIPERVQNAPAATVPKTAAPDAAAAADTAPNTGSARSAPSTPPVRLGSPPGGKAGGGNASRADADSPIILAPRAPARSEQQPAEPRPTARCNDIRQRAGLEDLSADERNFLRTQCR